MTNQCPLHSAQRTGCRQFVFQLTSLQFQQQIKEGVFQNSMHRSQWLTPQTNRGTVTAQWITTSQIIHTPHLNHSMNPRNCNKFTDSGLGKKRWTTAILRFSHFPKRSSQTHLSYMQVTHSAYKQPYPEWNQTLLGLPTTFLKPISWHLFTWWIIYTRKFPVGAISRLGRGIVRWQVSQK